MQLEVKRLKEIHEAQKDQTFQLQEYEQEKEPELQALGMAMKPQENWGIMEPYLNMELWGKSIFSP